MFTFQKLPGLSRDRVVDAIGPVLRAHGLVGVELIWRMDGQGRVLQVTVEPPAAAEEAPGEVRLGVTLDACAKLSRDLSTALDVVEAIPGRYRLEVGSPGLERNLHVLEDYRRFSGKLAKLKLLEVPASDPGAGHVLRGRLGGVTGEGQVLVQPEEEGISNGEPLTLDFTNIKSGQLLVDPQALGIGPNRFSPRSSQRSRRRASASGRR